MANSWTLNGVVLPRAPDSVEWAKGKGNFSYEQMLDGSERRLGLARKFSGRDVKLGWKTADERTLFALASAVYARTTIALVPGGLQPARQLMMNIDEQTKDVISQDVFDPRAGQGGFRRDIEIVGRGEPFFRSVNTVPSTLPTAAQVASWFGGPLGDNTLDFLPTWNGLAWNRLYTANATLTFSNLGTAPWPGVIRINGPFSSAVLTALYQDVDGTGQGVSFTWAGGNVALGDYIYFDTRLNAVFQSVSGTITQVYTYSLTLPGSANTPYPQWPLPLAGNFSVSISIGGADGSNTSLDYSNNGTEQFRYL